MSAGIAKGLNHQIGGAIDDGRLAVEIISRGDKGTKFDNACDTIKITAAGYFDLGNQIDRADACLFNSIFGGGIFPNSASCCQLV